MVPTGWIAWHSWRVNQPAHRLEVAAELSRQIGLEVQIESVSYPQPDRAQFRGVVLRVPRRPEAGSAGDGAELARIDRAVVDRDGRQWTLSLEGLTFRGNGPRDVMGLVEQGLARCASAPFDRAHVIAGRCQIGLGPDIAPFALDELAATLAFEGGSPRLTASYRLPTAAGAGDGAEPPRCELTLTHERRAGASRPVLTFRTLGGQSVPSTVLSPFFDPEGWLGDESRVAGELTLREDDTREWEASFRGTVQGVDLAQVVSRVAPHLGLAGRARLEIASARWANQAGRGPGWVEAQGKLVGGTGAISGALLAALRDQMRFRLPEGGLSARAEHRYQALGLEFVLSSTGELRLSGALGPDYLPGTVLAQGQRFGPLAAAPEGVVTVTSLVRALSPLDEGPTDRVIPARFESLMIQRYLPTPPAQAEAPQGFRAN